MVDRTRNFKSNASWFKQKKYEKNAPEARFFMKQNAPQARFIKQHAPQARMFDTVLMGTLSC
jgi:3-mercaptopyruvate sulfurtransferase SseA